MFVECAWVSLTSFFFFHYYFFPLQWFCCQGASAMRRAWFDVYSKPFCANDLLFISSRRSSGRCWEKRPDLHRRSFPAAAAALLLCFCSFALFLFSCSAAALWVLCCCSVSVLLLLCCSFNILLLCYSFAILLLCCCSVYAVLLLCFCSAALFLHCSCSVALALLLFLLLCCCSVALRVSQPRRQPRMGAGSTCREWSRPWQAVELIGWLNNYITY